VADSNYPVRIGATRPKESSRVLALLYVLFGIKMIGLIIQWIVLFVFAIAAGVVFFISQIIVLFGGKYPEGLFSFMRRVLRQSVKVSGWYYGLSDEFPPFAPNDDAYPVELSIDEPATSSRGWAVATMLLIVKPIALIPHLFILWALQIASGLIVWIGNIVVLFTGSFPAGMYSFVLGVMQWQHRVGAFFLGLCDKYPPFSLEMD
jgi:hypothetical protein